MTNFSQERTKLKTESLSSIFDEENLVNEELFGMSIENDRYTGHVIDINEMIKSLEALSAASEQMNNNATNMEDEEVVVNTDERTSMHTMDAAIGFIGVANDLYNLAVNGSPCAECGKMVKYMPPMGYCSLECAGKALAKRVLSHVTGQFGRETPKWIKKIKNILTYIDVALNLVTKLPDLIAGLAQMPPEYKDYATMKINIIFLYLKKVINWLMIQKNKLLIKLLKEIDDGTIDSNMMAVFTAINTVIQVIIQIRDAMNAALDIAMQAISKISVGFCIGPQEYGFFMTIKSVMCPCPYMINTCPAQSGQTPRPQWGPTCMTIPFDMSRCQLTIDLGGMSALQNVDMKKINKLIRAVFRPIMEVEYLLPPEIFDVRLALSDQNVPAIQKLIRLLELTCTIGGDMLPSYKNLQLWNIWFVIAILTCWGPTTRSIYGDFIFHAAIP